MPKVHNPRFLALVERAKSRIVEISAEDTSRVLADGSIPVLDIREESEWAAGHVAGAHYLGKGILERDVEDHFPDPTAPLILYCGGGFRSALAADALREMGYTDARSMAGGMRAWRARGLPEER